MLQNHARILLFNSGRDIKAGSTVILFCYYGTHTKQDDGTRLTSRMYDGPPEGCKLVNKSKRWHDLDTMKGGTAPTKAE